MEPATAVAAVPSGPGALRVDWTLSVDPALSQAVLVQANPGPTPDPELAVMAGFAAGNVATALVRGLPKATPFAVWVLAADASEAALSDPPALATTASQGTGQLEFGAVRAAATTSRKPS